MQLNVNDNYNPEKSMSTLEFAPFIHRIRNWENHAMKSLITASKKVALLFNNQLIKSEFYLEMTRKSPAKTMHFKY